MKNHIPIIIVLLYPKFKSIDLGKSEAIEIIRDYYN